MAKQSSVVFFGSGPVALASLKSLASDFDIEAIITKPATVNEMKSVVKDASAYAVNSREELDSLFAHSTFKSAVGILIDFGIIVSKKVIDYFPKGIINSHFSLLPQWRGADPITFAILSGQEQTGVSLMLLTSKMDEGPLLAQAPFPIPGDATTATLTSGLVEVSNQLVRTMLQLYLDNELALVAQEKGSIFNNTNPSYSRKLIKEDGVLDWTKPAVQLEREVRAFIVWPKSHTSLAGKEIIIMEAHVSDKHGQAGSAFVENKRLFIYCTEGALEIGRLKPAGKPEMSIAAFLAGYKLQL